MLTKQQKLDVLSKAIDEGANIDINFHDLTQSDAALLTKEIARMTGKQAEEKSGLGFSCYQVYDSKFMVNAFYKPEQSYMVEDVVRTIEGEVY